MCSRPPATASRPRASSWRKARSPDRPSGRDEDHCRRRRLLRRRAQHRQDRRLHVLRRQPQRCLLLRLRRYQESVRYQRRPELHGAPPGREVAVDRRRFQPRGNVFSTAIELPTASSAPSPTSASGGAAACGATASSSMPIGPVTRRSAASSTPTTPRRSTTPASRSTTAPAGLDQFVHLMGHTGNYTRDEAIAAIDGHALLPDMLSFDPSKPAEYPNGRSSPTTSSTSGSPSSPRATSRPTD